MTPETITAYAREWMLERAAIIEFDSGVPRREAELQAQMQWYKMCLNDPDLQVKVS